MAVGVVCWDTMVVQAGALLARTWSHSWYHRVVRWTMMARRTADRPLSVRRLFCLPRWS